MTERKTPWTPGPWKAFVTQDGRRLIGIGQAETAEGITDCGFGVWGWEDPQGKANARLIAAAPTIAEKAEALAEAMQEAIAALNGGPNTEGLHEQCEAALSDLQAELAAAKGGA